MKTHCWLYAVVFGAVAAVSVGPAWAQDAPPPPPPVQAEDYDDEAPDEDWVWVDAQQLQDGTVAEGFYRVRSRPDYTWTPGAYVDGIWIAPRWRWIAAPRVGFTYVAGHRGPDGYWVRGYWRKQARKGFRWVARVTVNGHRIHGHWAPDVPRADHVWVPGHWSRRGVWVPGHWRTASRAGYVWVNGHWRYGRWNAGFWKPLKPRTGHLWVGGYWKSGVWVSGMWRPRTKTGFYWRRGYWGPTGWVAGAWVNGKRPVLKRRHRVVRYDRMKQRRVNNRRMWTRGEAQRQHGKRQVRRGKAMNAAGKATGNKRLEKRGKAKTRRGKKNVRQGKQKKRRSKR